MSGRGKGLGKGGAIKHRKVIRDSIQMVSKSALIRLMHRSGVKSASGLIYEESRGLIKVILGDLVRDSVSFMQHARRKTVKYEDVKNALTLMGIHTYSQDINKKKYHTSKGKQGMPPKTENEKTHRFHPGTKALREIRRAQKSSDVIFSRTVFHRLIRGVAQDFHDELRFSPAALMLLQLYVEEHLGLIYEYAQSVALLSKRVRIQPKDIHATRYILGERS